jgi:hypothetical protein
MADAITANARQPISIASTISLAYGRDPAGTGLRGDFERSSCAPCGSVSTRALDSIETIRIGIYSQEDGAVFALFTGLVKIDS